MGAPGRNVASIGFAAVFIAAAAWVHFSRAPAGAPANQPARSAVEHGPFTRIEQARLAPDRANDGDSFRLAWGDENEAVFRLHFVDSPESYLRDFNRKRVGHQARYFGIEPKEAVATGEEAKRFAAEALGREEFTIFTRWNEVYDSGRYYAMIQLQTGPHAGRFLSELLVERGLARIYTIGTDTPNGQSRESFEDHLRRLQDAARAAGRGGWR